jgi:hypothetical protein
VGLVQADDVPLEFGEGFLFADELSIGGEHHVVRLGATE